MAAPLLSLPLLLPSSGLSHGIAPGAGAGLDWIGCTVSGWAWLVCWPGLVAGGVAGWGCCGSGGGLPAPLLLRSCSVVPALPLACLSACTGAGCSALPSGLAPAGLRRGAAVSGGQAGRWAGMIPLGWWAGAGDSRSSYCIILCLVFRHFSPLSVRLATHKMIDKYP